MSVSSIENGVSLRMQNQHNIKSGQKISNVRENFGLMHNKSQRNFGANRRGTLAVTNQGLSSHNLTKNMETSSSKVGLRINSHR